MIATILNLSVAAGTSVELFDRIEWSKLKLVKADSTVQLGILATTLTAVVTNFAGTELVTPESQVSGGGTAGVAPKIPDDIQYSFFALTFDELSCVIRNTDAATAVIINAIVSVDAVT